MQPEKTSRIQNPEMERITSLVEDRLKNNSFIRSKLPAYGRILIDRQVPFLCIYRGKSTGRESGAEKFTRALSSHLQCSAARSRHKDLAGLTEAVSRSLVRQFGTCLILELWDGPPAASEEVAALAEMVPEFLIVSSRSTPVSVSNFFSESLSRLKMMGNEAVINTRRSNHCCPKNLPPLLSDKAARDLGCHLVGIEISPFYLNRETGELYPYVMRRMSRQFNLAINRALYSYTRNHTSHRPPHFHSLGRRAIVKVVWETDKVLADISDRLDILLNITPLNAESGFNEFRKSRFMKRPQLHYRPLPFDPLSLKSSLYRAPVTRIEDPALSILFREQLEEMDRLIEMLRDRNTDRFLQSSLKVYGGVDSRLLELAHEILATLPSRSRSEKAATVGVRTFARAARMEIARYRRIHPELKAKVHIRDDVIGLLVSRGDLLISGRTGFSPDRVRALLNHEIGTHVLTYANGRSQPFHQLYTGLAGYESLQEGLAVLSEYLAGELSATRLRILAARVVAVHGMVTGIDFVENFHELIRRYRFTQRAAYGIILRAYRGGGLTKDALYLRGLRDLFEYLAKGGDFETLFVGKTGLSHLPVIRELMWRKVLKPPPLLPFYLEEDLPAERLARIRAGMTLAEVVKKLRKGN